VREIEGLLGGVLALVEGAVGDALEELGVVPEGVDVRPGDFVGGPAEVVVAERLEAGEHLVDLLLPGDEGGERVLPDLAIWFWVLWLIVGLRSVFLAEPMNASLTGNIKRKSERATRLSA
jgi:hypothetical protein